MLRIRILALVTAISVSAAASAGCGLGPGDDAGEAELTITRGYGAEQLRQEQVELSESDSVMRVLDRSAEIETRYGGGFVQSIDGTSGTRGDRRSDWFFYVNGIEASEGASSYLPGDGDRIWWDYRDWTSALRTPALVGSWPEPFIHGFDGERWRAVLVCSTPVVSLCDAADRQSDASGVEAERADDDSQTASDAARILVGTWVELKDDQVAGLLDSPPARSGVFARFSEGDSGTRLALLDARSEIAQTLGPGGGLVAALRPEDGPPTWVVTGTDAAGVSAATELLGEPLRNRYAVASFGEATIPVPAEVDE